MTTKQRNGIMVYINELDNQYEVECEVCHTVLSCDFDMNILNLAFEKNWRLLSKNNKMFTICKECGDFISANDLQKMAENNSFADFS